MLTSSYLLYKLLHLVAVVLFLGNATLGLFWVSHAQRTRDARLIGHAMDGIMRGDRWFTWPGVIAILVGGVGAAMALGLKLLAVGWMAWSIGLLSLSGLVFSIWLAPLQRKIVLCAAEPTPNAAQLDAMLRRWHLVGWFSLGPLWLALAAMVLKWPH